MTDTFRAILRSQSEIPVIDLSGDLSYLADHELMEAYKEAALSHPSTILINFSDVRFINSRGIALIINLLKEAQQAKIRLYAWGLNGYFERIFSISRLTDFMPLFHDESSAIAAINQEVAR